MITHRHVKMRRALQASLAATTVMAVMAAPSVATPPQDADRTALQERLDRIVDDGAVGAVAQVRDEDGSWRSTSGVAELGTTRTVPVNGRFRVGSITKTLVATVVLQLVDEGRLRLEDPVETWLPEVVPNGERITVRHLLNHTSGVYDYLKTLPPPSSQEFIDNRLRTWTADELVQRAVVHPPTFETPGSAFAYSNTNYVLLGQIIEGATDQSYGVQIERRVTRPLRLHDTILPGTFPRIRGPHPHGYLPIQRDGEMSLVDYTEMNPSVMGASGEMISSTKDLDRFFAALLGGRLLPQHLLEEMKTPGVTSRMYGLGLSWRDTTCGIRAYGNDGDALAYVSYSFTSADLQRHVTVALTPNFQREPDEAIDAFLDEAMCG